MGTFWVKLGYQKDLSLSQKLVIELIGMKTFSLGELASIIDMRKNHFKGRVIKGLDDYLTIDSKGFVTPRKDIDKVLEKNFDKERLEAVQSCIKDERDDYKTKFLFEPLRRLLEEANEGILL
jgi:hypothetical protein